MDLPPPRKILKELAKLSHSCLMPPPPILRKILKDFVEKSQLPNATPLCITASGNILASGNLCSRVFKLQLKVIKKNVCYLYSV